MGVMGLRKGQGALEWLTGERGARSKEAVASRGQTT